MESNTKTYVEQPYRVFRGCHLGWSIGHFPTFGAATNPKHWHVFFFPFKSKGKKYEWKDKE
jgi:hypothetical protein